MLRRVVITGMGCLSPNGLGNEAFCSAILAGKSGVKRVSRFDASDLPVQIAGEITDFDEMAWMEAKERKHVSRVVPLSIAASSEALADAGFDAQKIAAMSMDQKREIGVILGTGGGAQDFSEAQYLLWLAGKIKQVSLFSIPSGTMGTLSSEISMRFGLRGMSQVVTSGCTSSTDAIAYAMRQIQLGTIPMMLTGGADSPIAPGIMKGFTLMRIMTEKWNEEPQRGSRPFSRDRDGFVIAEGAWMFLLEDYEHAKARGAKIYAEIAGYGSTCEAFHRVRLDECGEEPARAIGLAMKEAGVGPNDIHYANLHGTSTQLNDRIETRALKMALGEERARQVPMSALKSQIGHPQGACGAAGIAATLIAMKHGEIPPTINLDSADPECDLDYVAYRNGLAGPYIPRKAEIEHAICNCIAFGSKNSAMVLRKV
jgi:3-oxoacyl-[acyl-carrier-protein] synthase II